MRIATILFLVVIMLGGALGYLVYTGKININFSTKRSKPAERPVPRGMTLIPSNLRELLANTLITREMLMDQSGKVAKQPVNLAELQDRGVMTSEVEIVGRVLRRDKHPGYVFMEGDFYPKGTKGGITAAIPPGKRSVTIDAAKLTGARLLKPRDHVDLLASQAYDPSKKSLTVGSGGITTPTPANMVKQATIRVLAQDAVVITPVTVRPAPTAPGTRSRAKPGEEISIAVDASEVEGLMEAIAAGAEIACALHSGQPENSSVEDRLPPPPEPPPVTSNVATVEAIIGRNHKLLVVPSLGGQSTQSQTTPPLVSTPGDNGNR